MNVYLIKVFKLRYALHIHIYVCIYAALLCYMLNSWSLRQTLFDSNPMNASIRYQFYKTVFRLILFLTFQQHCEVDIVIIFPMQEIKKLIQNTEVAQYYSANK